MRQTDRKKRRNGLKIDGNFIFEAPQKMVWDTLQDPATLASILPGCERLELIGETEYEGVLNIKVGPVQGTFVSKVKLADLDEPNSYNMKIDGRGPAGFVHATASVELETEDEHTRLTYESNAQVGGRVANVGQRLLDSSAKAITKQTCLALNEVLKARVAIDAGKLSNEEAARPTGPSQAEFASNVAKQVAKDLIPFPARIALVVSGVVFVLLLAYFLMR